MTRPTPLRTRTGQRAALATLRRVSTVAAACLLLSAGAARAAEPVVDDKVVVKPGDTLSAIAARFTGDARQWRRLYHPKLSGLSNPDLITVGSTLELVTDGNRRYLRLAGTRVAAAAAPAAPAAPVAAAPAPAAAPAAPAPAAEPAAQPAAAADAGTVIGLLPNIGAAALMGQYESLKRYLERNGHKVRIVLPANFKAFFDSTMKGDYDIAVAAPHFARVAQLDRGMVPLVTYEPRIGALFVAPTEGGASGPAAVREKAVAFANPQSLVAMYGQQWLRQSGLEPGKDYEIKGARSDLGVGRMLLTGDAVAAIMSNGEFRALPSEESARLKVVEVFARIPNFIWLAHPRVDAARQAQLRRLLKDFLADKEDGAAFAKATGFTGIVDVDEATLKELDPYVAPTRRAMGYGN